MYIFPSIEDPAFVFLPRNSTLCDESIQFCFCFSVSRCGHSSFHLSCPLSVSVIGPYHGHHASYIYTYMVHGDGTERVHNFWWRNDGSVLFFAIRTNYICNTTYTYYNVTIMMIIVVTILTPSHLPSSRYMYEVLQRERGTFVSNDGY
jgi:hypothetical protein